MKINPWPWLLFGLLILAVVSEVLQFFVDNRLPRLGDLIIDGAGLVLGLTLFEILRRVRMAMAAK